MTEELTAKRQDNGVYRIAYDGRVLGDSKGYSSEVECLAAIDNELAIDRRDAVRYDRPLLYHKG